MATILGTILQKTASCIFLFVAKYLIWTYDYKWKILFYMIAIKGKNIIG